MSDSNELTPRVKRLLGIADAVDDTEELLKISDRMASFLCEREVITRETLAAMNPTTDFERMLLASYLEEDGWTIQNVDGQFEYVPFNELSDDEQKAFGLAGRARSSRSQRLASCHAADRLARLRRRWGMEP